MKHAYPKLFALGPDETPYRKLSADGVRIEHALGAEMLVVDREAIRLLSEQALIDINHLLRPGHLKQLAHILEDPEATSNDKFVAFDLLKNANIAAGGVLPVCQDTGTPILGANKGPPAATEGYHQATIAESNRGPYAD